MNLTSETQSEACFLCDSWAYCINC